MADSVGCGISLLCRLECSCTHEMEPAGGIFWVFAWGNTLICFACFGSIAISLCGVGRDWSSRRLMSMYWSYVGAQTNIGWDGVM